MHTRKLSLCEFRQRSSLCSATNIVQGAGSTNTECTFTLVERPCAPEDLLFVVLGVFELLLLLLVLLLDVLLVGDLLLLLLLLEEDALARFALSLAALSTQASYEASRNSVTKPTCLTVGMVDVLTLCSQQFWPDLVCLAFQYTPTLHPDVARHKLVHAACDGTYFRLYPDNSPPAGTSHPNHWQAESSPTAAAEASQLVASTHSSCFWKVALGAMSHRSCTPGSRSTYAFGTKRN